MNDRLEREKRFLVFQMIGALFSNIQLLTKMDHTFCCKQFCKIIQKFLANIFTEQLLFLGPVWGGGMQG